MMIFLAICAFIVAVASTTAAVVLILLYQRLRGVNLWKVQAVFESMKRREREMRSVRPWG
jgi:hypothetical protein